MPFAEIPVTNDPNQVFEVSLPLDSGNLVLEFRIYWNRIAEYWQANIKDLSQGIEVITGLPLIAGEGYYSNLFALWEYLEIGQLYIIPLGNNGLKNPGLEDWGVNYTLGWSS